MICRTVRQSVIFSLPTSLKLDELYVEIMYCILHMIGSDAEREEQSALITHLREAFHMDDDKHAQGRTALRVLLLSFLLRRMPLLRFGPEGPSAATMVGVERARTCRFSCRTSRACGRSPTSRQTSRSSRRSHSLERDGRRAIHSFMDYLENIQNLSGNFGTLFSQFCRSYPVWIKRVSQKDF